MFLFLVSPEKVPRGHARGSIVPSGQKKPAGHGPRPG